MVCGEPAIGSTGDSGLPIDPNDRHTAHAVPGSPCGGLSSGKDARNVVFEVDQLLEAELCLNDLEPAPGPFAVASEFVTELFCNDNLLNAGQRAEGGMKQTQR